VGFTRRPDCEYSDGVIRGIDHGPRFTVELDDGSETIAYIPKSTLRRVGCLIGDLTGWRVTIVHRPSDKPDVIVDIRRL